MMHQKGACKFRIKSVSIDFKILKSIIKVGLPAGIQSALFAVSNIVITSAFNSFDKTTVHARTVVQSVDGIVSTLITSYARSTLALTAQNYGAGNLKRVKKVFFYSIIQTVIISVCVAQVILLFCRPIASLYIGSNNENIEEILNIAEGFFRVLLNTYFLCGIMDILSSALRGIKYSVTTMIISLACAIPFRIGWVYLVFPHEPFNTANWLMASFPVSWVIAIIPYTIIIIFAWKKLSKKFSEKKIEELKNAN